MRVGTNVGENPPSDVSEIPAEGVRFMALEPPPFKWHMVPLIERLHAAGKRGLARVPFEVPDAWGDLSTWLADWAALDCEMHEAGNEIPPAAWDRYRHEWLPTVSPILRAQGRKVILAAPRTNLTDDWLLTTPDSVWMEVDGVALHPYACRPMDVLAHVEENRPLIPDHLPIHVTEFGWGVNPGPQWADHPLVVTYEHNQAMKIEATLRLLDQHARALDLRDAYVFMHRDVPDNGHWWWRAGTRRLDNSPRPSFEIVAKASSGSL